LFAPPVRVAAVYAAPPRAPRNIGGRVPVLVVLAVTAAVAVVAHTLIPTMPWAAAIALGAVVAPPDAVAATAVLRQLRPPHRILTILEGESLLNDASALLIFRLAVGAVAANGFSIAAVAPTFLLAVVGSLAVRWGLGWLLLPLGVRWAARADRHYSSVRQHVWRVDARRWRWTLGCADDGVLCHYGSPDCASANSRRDPHTDLCSVGDRRVRTEHPGLYL